VARKLTDTVKLQVRLSERLRRRLEQAAKHNDWSMNTEIVSRLDTSFLEKEQEKLIAVAIEQAATATAGRLRQEFQPLIVTRLDTSFLEKEQEKLIAVAIEQAATATAGRLGQEFQEFWQWIRSQEATKHPAPPDKEESNRSEGPSP
jgi:hypothetical protein